VAPRGLPLRRTFCYRLPPGMRVELGTRVRVPLGGRTVEGYAVGFPLVPPERELLEVLEVLEPGWIPPDLVEVLKEVSARHHIPLGELVEASLPGHRAMAPPEEVPLGWRGPPSKRAWAIAAQVLAQDRPCLIWEPWGGERWGVYGLLVEEVRRRGRNALLLVPEASLAQATAARLGKLLGEGVVAFHRGLTRVEQRRRWEGALRGEVVAVVGTRSAALCPLPRLGLVVVEEEGSEAYRPEGPARYPAREVALLRARRAGALAVLGGAVPSVESYARAQRGEYLLISLSPLMEGPRFRLLEEPEGGQLLSDPLWETLEEVRGQGERALIFLNRRGLARWAICRSCRRTVRCPRCDLPLSFHGQERSLHCHLCGVDLPPRCSCGGRVLRMGGWGTERLELALRRRWPNLRVLRVDRDTVPRRRSAKDVLRRMRQGDYEVLVATQLVEGKGLPPFGLVAIVQAEALLNLPHLRAAEDALRIMHRLAWESQAAEVVVQSANPHHPALRALDPRWREAFYVEELEHRRELGYPPFGCLAEVRIAGPGAGQWVQRALRRLHPQGAEVLGPTFWGRLRGKERWRLLLKGPEGEVQRLLAVLEEARRAEIALSVELIV